MNHQSRPTTIIALTLLTTLALLLTTSCDSPDPTSPASQARLQLSAAPQEIPADGESTSVIRAYVLDPEGAPAEGVPIFWTTDHGYLESGSDTVAAGVAETTLRAALYPAVATVKATVTLPTRIENSIQVRFTEASSSGLQLSADPTSIPADGSSQSILRAKATTSDGLPVPDGTTIYFATTAGTLSAESATTTNGEAYVYLTSSTTEQTAQISATSGSATAKTEVFFYSVEVGWIDLRASTHTPGTDEDVILFAAVYSRDGRPIRDGISVYFTASFEGTKVNLEPDVASTEDGVAVARLSCMGVNITRGNPEIEVRASAGGVTSNVLAIRMSCTYQSSSSTDTPTPTPTRTPSSTPTPSPSPTQVPTDTPTPEPTFSLTPTP
jgi:hypothetical protein